MRSAITTIFRLDEGQDCVTTPITGMTLEIRTANIAPG
jgi:hypothetical protein